MSHRVEFSTERSRSYKLALSQFPNCWEEDKILMSEYFSPAIGETILELGAGSGFFSFDIAQAIGEKGHLFVVDPSPEQVKPILESDAENITVVQKPAEELNFPSDLQLDGIWSRGAFHHVKDKHQVLNKIGEFSKPGARLVICDIFSGTKLADYFDEHVAVTCTTGHEVNFLSKSFAKSLCRNTGWSEPEFDDISLQWQFETEADIGLFLSLLHSNKPEFSAEHSLHDAKRLLGLKEPPLAGRSIGQGQS